MSPEQAQGETTDGQTDVYSLGIVLYEMLAGKLPFDGETTLGILLKHVNEPPPPIPGLSPFMQDVINRSLAKNREDRFPSPTDFAKSFSAAVEINPATIQMDALAPAGPSTMQMDVPAETKVQDKSERPKRFDWIRIAISAGIALIFGSFIFFNGLPSSASATETLTATISSSPASLPTITNISTMTPLPINLETSLILHFRDANAIADQAFLAVNRVPAPPNGNKYEVWLFSEQERISLGLLSLDSSGKGSLIYTDEQGSNLIAMYDQAEITVESDDDNSQDPTNLIAFSFVLPEEGSVNLRSLLSSFAVAPEKTALVQGFYSDIQTINKLAGEMDTAYTSGDESLTRQSAEAIMNLIVGEQSPDYKDWDGDGSITNESTGYGLEFNGTNLGYLGAIYTEADRAVKSNNASQPMRIYGEKLKASVQNLAQWSPQLQELIVAILESPEGTDLKEHIVDVAILADQMLNGLDMNRNGTIEDELGEGGAQAVYTYAYAMADMPLTATGLIAGIGTPTPPGGLYEPTSVGGGNGGGGGGAVPTEHIPPGQVKTDKPKPTKKNPGGGGGGGGNGGGNNNN
jgi:serine/threonine protein kinase